MPRTLVQDSLRRGLLEMASLTGLRAAALAASLCFFACSPAAEEAATTDATLEVATADVGQGQLDGGDSACQTDADCAATSDPCRPSVCLAGTCIAGANQCQCTDDWGCGAWDDGNACNGTLYCNTAKVPYVCALKPGSVIACDTSKDTLCKETRCDPVSGSCKPTAVHASALCEDGLLCTSGDHCADGECTAGPQSDCLCTTNADCASQEDGDLCNGTLHCDTSVKTGYVCAVNPVTVVGCSSQGLGPCETRVCAPKTGSCATVALPDGVACDDGDAKTSGDHCEAGACTPGTWLGSCKTGADCASKEDGNACNGTLYCDLKTQKCVLNPATVVTCSPALDTDCKANVCSPATGTCALTAVADTTICDDKDVCTVGEVCTSGSCLGGTNTCLCKTDADCAGKDDGDVCNGHLACNTQTGTCFLNQTSAVVCPTASDSACIKAACVPLSGACTPTAIERTTQTCDLPGGLCRRTVSPATAPDAVATVCEDGDACTAGDVCAKGACIAGTFACACAADSDCTDDGDLCNGTVYCDKKATPATCKNNPATVISCAVTWNDACKLNLCDKATGTCALTPLSDGKPCTDGQPCTKGDACLKGVCSAGVMTCACLSDADCAPTDDGDVCNGVPYCDKSDPANPACKPNPASVVFCVPELASCVANACHPKTGTCSLQASDEGEPCQDSDACTTKTVCKGGSCSGVAVDCDDKNACTADSCNALAGCVNQAKGCDDGNPCTTDSCDVKTGQCAAVKLSDTPCDADKNGCTVGDVCKLGVCAVGPKVSCSGAVGACEVMACSSTGSYQHVCTKLVRPDGATCDDGEACKVGATCASGVCKSGAQERLFAVARQHAEGDLAFVGAAARQEGGALVVGTVRKSSDGGGLLGTITPLSPGGSVDGDVLTVALGGGAATGLHAAIGLTTGGAVAVGSALAAVEGALVIRVTDAGSQVWKKSVSSGAPQRALAVDANAAAGLAVAGERIVGATAQGWVARLSMGGTLLWQQTLSDSLPRTAKACVVQTDGQVTVAGTAGTGALTQGWLAWLMADGKISHQQLLDTDAGLSALAQDGTQWLAAGYRVVAGTRRAWLLRLQDDGAVVWQRTSPGSFDVRGMRHRGDGRMLLSGTANPNNQLVGDLWVTATDKFGNREWDWSYGVVGAERGGGVTALADGGVLATGAAAPAGGGEGLVVRLDGWGHGSCAAAGGCLTKTLSACDDTKACTRDGCQANAGCTHVQAGAMACEGTACTTIATCAGGSCKPSSNGTLYTQTDAAVANYEAMVPLKGGGMAVAWLTSTTTAKIWHVRRLGGDGATLWTESKVVPDATAATMGGMIQASDGRIVSTILANGPWALMYWMLDVHGTTKTPPTRQYFDPVYKKAGSQTASPGVAEPIPGQFYVVGRSDWNETTYLRGTHLVTGKLGYSLVLANAKYSSVAHLVQREQRLVACGWVAAGGVNHFLVTAQQLPGTSKWQVTRTDESACYRASPRKDGSTMLLGGHRTATGAWRLFAQRVSGTGASLWLHELPDYTGWGSLVAPLETADGGTLLLYGQKNGLITQVRGRWLGKDGLLLRERAWTTDATFADVRTDGAYLLAAGQVGGKATAWRFDAWLHTSCADVGACAGKTAADCDDGKACTADFCDAAKGCSHAAAPCDDGDPCTLDTCSEQQGCTHTKQPCP